MEYNLRNYKHKDQLGMERTPQQYVTNLVNIFRECKRVLKKTGAIWVNIADSYNDNKSLRGIPERLRIRLEDDLNLICRNDIIWMKPSCMPSSAKDRFTIDFEHFYFFVKSNDTLLWRHRKHSVWTTIKPEIGYHIPAEENDTWEWYETFDGKRKQRSLWDSYDYYFETQYEPMKTVYEAEYKGTSIKDYTANKVQDPSELKRRMLKKFKEKQSRFGGNKYNDPDNLFKPDGTNYHGSMWEPNPNFERIKRTVWSINTPNSTENHFATFPEQLIEIPIKACTNTTDKSLVLDPFLGSGTTAIKAQKMGRKYVGVELNEDYVSIAKRRLNSMITSYITRG